MAGPSFGIHISRGADGGFDYPVEQARTAVSRGFDSIWVADHLNGFPVDAPVFDPFTLMGFLAREAPGLRIGLAATDPYRRHPALLAQAFSTISAMTGSAPVLVLGAGEGQNIGPYGWAIERPLSRIREVIGVIRALLDTDVDHQLTLDTAHYQFRDAFLQLAAEAPKPAIHLAANGPKMRAMIGELADGWVPMMLTPRMIANDLADIRVAAERAGRDPAAVEVVYHTSVVLGDSKAEALPRLALASKRTFIGYPAMAARLGHPVTEAYNYRYLEVQRETQQAVNAAADEIPAEAFAGTGIYGTPDDWVEQIQAYTEAGVNHFVFRCFDPVGVVGEVFESQIASKVRG
jgi:phthiodiolone/phenolphthiodiolone dimycocerosates ketoreductase